MIFSRLTARRLNFPIGILQAEYLMLRSNSGLDAHDIGLNDQIHWSPATAGSSIL